MQVGGDDGFGQHVFHVALHGALQRAGTILLVPALFGNKVHGLFGEFNLVAHLFNAFHHLTNLNLDNLVDIFLIQ